MESLIEFYFRLFEYIKANWKKYIELFKKMSTFEKSIQCFLFMHRNNYYILCNSRSS